MSIIYKFNLKTLTVSNSKEVVAKGLKLFSLYTRLALEVIYKNTPKGQVRIDEIWTLRGWERYSSRQNIGKVIHSEIQKKRRADKNIIGYDKISSGPYWLQLSSDQIEFSDPIEFINDFLWPSFFNMGVKTNRAVDILYQHSKQLWEAHFVFYSGGKLTEAYSLYEKSLDERKLPPEFKVKVLLNLSRIKDRLGQLKKALSLAEYALNISNKLSKNKTTLVAECLLRKAWINYKMNDFKTAEKILAKVYPLIISCNQYSFLGLYYHILGLIYTKKHLFKRALYIHQRSLESYLFSSFEYGIQAAYFNIANLYYNWAVFETNNIIKMNYFEEAIEWAKRCKEFCRIADTGKDQCEEKILISSCYLKLGNISQAERYAKFAEDIVENETFENIDNKFKYYFLKGELYLEKNELQKANTAFCECLRCCKELKDYVSLDKIKKQLDDIQHHCCPKKLK